MVALLFSLFQSPVHFYPRFLVDNVKKKKSKHPPTKKEKKEKTSVCCPRKETTENIALQLKHKMEIVASQRASNASKPARNGRL